MKHPARSRLLAAAYFGCCLALFAALHLRSVVSAPGVMLDGLPGYWQWLYDHLISREQLQAPKQSRYFLSNGLAFASVMIALLLGYLTLIWSLRRQPLSRWGVLLLTLACAGPMLIAPHLLSGDVYSYVNWARLQAVHQVNPYTVPLSTFSDDPYYRLVYWTDDLPPAYGPVWMLLSGLLTRLVEACGGGLGNYLLAYKLAALLLHLLNGGLIHRLLRRWDPERADLTAAIYLLHPLCLIEFAGSAHNDVLLITLVLLGLYCWQRGWLVVAALWLGLATLTKIYALPVLCLFAVGVARGQQTWRAGLVGGGGVFGLFGLLAAGLYYPYWEGTQTIAFLQGNHMERSINSLVELAEVSLDRARWPRLAALGCVALACLIGAARTRDARSGAAMAALYALCLVGIGAAWFWPWYVTFPLALALAADAPRIRGVALTLSLTAPLLYGIHALHLPLEQPYRQLGLLFHYRSLLVFAPPGLVAAGLLLRGCLSGRPEEPARRDS